MKVSGGINTNGNLGGIGKLNSDPLKDLKSNKTNQDSLSSGEISNSAKVDVSQRAKDMQRIKDIAMNAEDIDMEKVNRLQKLIDEGDYKIDAAGVADRMLDEHLMMND